MRSAITGADPRLLLLALLVSFFALNAGLLLRPDWPVQGGDTPRILEEAQRLATGRSLGPTGTAFLVPHAVLAAIYRFGNDLRQYVVIQLLLAGCAAAALFGSIRLAGGSNVAALLGSAAWAFNPMAQAWNYFLLSDAIYQSLAVITVFVLARAVDQPRPVWTAAAVVSLAAISLSRPQGQLWPLIGALLLLVRAGTMRLAWALAAALLVCEAGLLALNRPYAAYMNLVQYFEKGQVIWGQPNYLLTMPAWHGADGGGMRSVIEYVAAHPFASIKLAAIRVVVEMSAVRPFYSTMHNVISAVVYWPLFGFAAIGWWRAPASTIKTLTLLVIVSHLAMVGVTHADSDGRWFLQVLPSFLIWGTIGALMSIDAWTARSRAHAR